MRYGPSAQDFNAVTLVVTWRFNQLLQNPTKSTLVHFSSMRAVVICSFSITYNIERVMHD
jgi:hypothetical protein